MVGVVTILLDDACPAEVQEPPDDAKRHQSHVREISSLRWRGTLWTTTN
jgi:hypothetical protein